MDIRSSGHSSPSPPKARLLRANLSRRTCCSRCRATRRTPSGQHRRDLRRRRPHQQLPRRRLGRVQRPERWSTTTSHRDGQGGAPSFRSAAGQRLLEPRRPRRRDRRRRESDASESVRNALVRVGIVGGGALLLLLLVTAFTAAVARSVSSRCAGCGRPPWKRRTCGCPPPSSRSSAKGPTPVVLPPALPAGEGGGPETAEVARAVDGLTSEAVRLASAQVRLRRSLDDAFVSMSRRSQSMVEKQLAIIDELERTEEDPDQLRNLFRLDHLAARMRRYNDNLLVLAGSVGPHPDATRRCPSRTSSGPPPPRWSSTSGSGCSRSAALPSPVPPPAASSTCSRSCSTTRPCTRRRPARS